MLHPSNSPFTPDQPIAEEERFFGRGDVIEWVDDLLAAGERFILIYGTPRMGKTSLLLRLRTKLGGKASPAYVDLSSIVRAPAAEMLWQLVEDVHRQIGQGRAELGGLWREGYNDRPNYLRERVFPAWRQVLRGRPLVLLLDGLRLEMLQEGPWAELLLRLRELFANEAGLCAVAAVHGASTASKEPLPALRGLPLRDLEGLSEEQAEEMLVGLARYQLAFDYDALRSIYAWTGGHPYFLQVFGAELYRRLAPHGQVTIHVVTEVAKVVLSLVQELFSRDWAALAREERVTLAAIGSLPSYRGAVGSWDLVIYLRRSGVERTSVAMEASLQELCSRRILRWFGGSAYALHCELFHTWLAHRYPLAEVLTGKQRRRGDVLARRRSLAVNWGALLVWAGIGLAVLVVARVWATRGSASPIDPLPTPSYVQVMPRPTPTRVVLPGRIAYMAQATPQDPWCIWVMRDDGSDPVRLTDGDAQDAMPVWSPDGKQLAFVSSRSGNRDVWVMGVDGTRLENVTRSAADEWTPAWSPDGLSIAYASSHDGNWELYVAKADGSAPRRITSHPAPDYAPTWSPDGGRLAFVSEQDGNPEIYVVNQDGSGLQRLTRNQVTDLAPAWSPDGRLIVFVSNRDGNMEIYTMATDGSDARNVSEEPESDEHGPAWSPDGRWIAFFSNRDGNWDIWRMRADGNQKTNLTRSATIEQVPAWQPQPPTP